ncbi:MAG: STAS domain-containing protein [Acidimicrobiales bacterium]
MSSDESPSFSVETVEEMGSITVQATGEIDVATAPQIEAELIAAIEGGSAVTLDLSGVSFIDSSGLRALVTARQRAEEKGVAFSLAGRSPAVERLLQVTGLDGVFQSS